MKIILLCCSLSFMWEIVKTYLMISHFSPKGSKIVQPFPSPRRFLVGFPAVVPFLVFCAPDLIRHQRIQLSISKQNFPHFILQILTAFYLRLIDRLHNQFCLAQKQLHSQKMIKIAVAVLLVVAIAGCPAARYARSDRLRTIPPPILFYHTSMINFVLPNVSNSD